MTGCRCWACTHPTPENAGLRTLHTIRHIEFGEWLAVRAPFTEPSPSALVVMTAAEMWVPNVPTVCRESRHIGAPRHSAVH